MDVIGKTGYMEKTVGKGGVRRLAVFASYHREGMIDPYKVKILEGIRPYAARLIVVCNGIMKEEGQRILSGVADEVIVRNNEGYDAGAYKDVLLQMQEKEELTGYNELILLNDTFFGFFYPLDEFFCEVYKNNNIDFWGFTKHPKGEDVAGNKQDEHVQSYFLLIRQKMFQSHDFLEFWKRLRYPVSYKDAVSNFEIAFSVYFKERGFLGDAYCNLKKIGLKTRYNENPYALYSYELISKARCPVLKIKSTYLEATDHIEGAFQTIDFLERHGLYDTNIIRQYMDGICGSEDRKPYFDVRKLKKFCAKYNEIYIYGNGKYGKRVQKYLAMQGIEVKKVIVSRKGKEDSENVMEFEDLKIKSDMGIVVALNEENAVQVLGNIIAVAKQEQIFTGRIDRKC